MTFDANVDNIVNFVVIEKSNDKLLYAHKRWSSVESYKMLQNLNPLFSSVRCKYSLRLL